MYKNLTFILLTLLSCSAIAEKNQYYFKANLGSGYIHQFKDRATDLSLKGQYNLFFGAGFGYYLIDNVRFELTLNHYVNPELSKTGIVDGVRGNITAQHRANINDLIFSALFDIFKSEKLSLYGGIGVGGVRIKECVSISGGIDYTDNITSIGTKTNITYAVYLGTSYKLAPNIVTELTYSFKEFGKTKLDKNILDREIGNNRYHGQHLSIGFRFDI